MKGHHPLRSVLSDPFLPPLVPGERKVVTELFSVLQTDLRITCFSVSLGLRGSLTTCEYDNYPEIEKYVGYGLKGIEVSHMSMKEKDYPLTREYAAKLNLVKTGGSDFHNVHLTVMGEHGLSREEFEELKAAVGEA